MRSSLTRKSAVATATVETHAHFLTNPTHVLRFWLTVSSCILLHVYIWYIEQQTSFSQKKLLSALPEDGEVSIERGNASSGRHLESERYFTFCRTYLVGFLLATFADWMLGPYIYVLYESYGYVQVYTMSLSVQCQTVFVYSGPLGQSVFFSF